MKVSERVMKKRVRVRHKFNSMQFDCREGWDRHHG